MYKPVGRVKNTLSGVYNGLLQHSTNYACRPKSLQMDKILIISKMTRYQYERKKLKHLNDNDFKFFLEKRGSNYEKLLYYYNLQKNITDSVASILQDMGSDVKIVNRFSYTYEDVKWADLIVPTGGDGTFLLAASRVTDNVKPLVGINSDTTKSEGHLCLPKHFSSNIEDAFQRMKKGNFQWLMRSRIRIKVISKHKIKPEFLHSVEDHAQQTPIGELSECENDATVKILPVLALNEVFFGETLSAKVSNLTIRFNTEPTVTNLKCSGICVATGTGSTCWHLSMNRLPAENVYQLLQLMGSNSCKHTEAAAVSLAKKYNQNLIFSPDDERMQYTIRDVISAGVWPQPKGIKARGFATSIEVKSNCYDAFLVIDGGISYSFNDGVIAVLESRPQDSLRTVVVLDN